MNLRKSSSDNDSSENPYEERTVRHMLYRAVSDPAAKTELDKAEYLDDSRYLKAYGKLYSITFVSELQDDRKSVHERINTAIEKLNDEKNKAEAQLSSQAVIQALQSKAPGSERKDQDAKAHVANQDDKNKTLAELRIWVMQLHQMIKNDVSYAAKKDKIIKEAAKRFGDLSREIPTERLGKLFEQIESLDMAKIMEIDLAKMPELLWMHYNVAIKLAYAGSSTTLDPVLEQIHGIKLNEYFDNNGVPKESFEIQTIVNSINEKMGIKDKEKDKKEMKSAREGVFKIYEWAANLEKKKVPKPEEIIVGDLAEKIKALYQNTTLSWTEKLNQMTDKVAEFAVKYDHDKNKKSIMKLMEPLKKIITNSPTLNDKYTLCRNKYLPQEKKEAEQEKKKEAEQDKKKETEQDNEIKEIVSKIKEIIYKIRLDGTDCLKMQGVIFHFENDSKNSSIDKLEKLILAIEYNLKNLTPRSKEGLKNDEGKAELVLVLEKAKIDYFSQVPQSKRVGRHR